VSNSVSRQIWHQASSQLSDPIWNQIDNSIGDQIKNQISNWITDEIFDQISEQVNSYSIDYALDDISSQVWEQLNNQISEPIKNQVKNRSINQKMEWIDPSYYLSGFNSWLSFYSYFDNEVLSLDLSDLLRKYSKVLDLNIFWGVTLSGLCIVSKNAIEYNRDAQFRLHSTTKASVVFPGDTFQYKLYFIHGIGISEELFYKLENKTYTFDEFINEKNEEIKSAILSFFQERWGNEYVCNFLSKNLKEIDTYVDKKTDEYLVGTTKGMNIGVYTLFKGTINKINLSFVRCYCPSTDRLFFLSTEPKFDKAADAIASLYRIPKKLVKEIKYIQRQGERFSTVLTDNGQKILKSLSNSEIQNLTSISGSEYFSKMKYEF
jgi:N-glycosylase/DNA lyase